MISTINKDHRRPTPMPKWQSIIQQIMKRLQSALDSRPADVQGLFSITLAVPELTLHGLPPLTGNWFYWGKPSTREYRLGLGEALRLSTTGNDRLQRLSDRFEQRRSDWRQLDPDRTGLHPTAFVGFAFEPNDPMEHNWRGLPNAALFFPELLLQQTADRCALTFSFTHREQARALLRSRHLLQALLQGLSQQPGGRIRTTTLARTATIPSDADWIRQVTAATDLIRQGGLDKVVPFRRLSVRARHPFNPSRLIASLDDLYPSSLLFSIRLDGSTFVSATPERLIGRQGHAIHCDAVGGTLRRSPDPIEDAALGELLLKDPKSRHEHALVVEGILASLRPHCSGLSAPPVPSLRQLRKLQHLWTGISGRLPSDNTSTLLRIADALHPTAAVSGFPSTDAGHWLSENQTAPRGWYTGAAGWVDNRGDGELAVLLRCALLNGAHAELFAGAGVTRESCPVAELQETELKFGTMLEALEHA